MIAVLPAVCALLRSTQSCIKAISPVWAMSAHTHVFVCVARETTVAHSGIALVQFVQAPRTTTAHDMPAYRHNVFDTQCRLTELPHRKARNVFAVRAAVLSRGGR